MVVVEQVHIGPHLRLEARPEIHLSTPPRTNDATLFIQCNEFCYHKEPQETITAGILLGVKKVDLDCKAFHKKLD